MAKRQKDKEVKILRSTGVLEKKGMPELVKIYNELNPDNQVEKFPSKSAAAMAIIQRLAYPLTGQKDKRYKKIDFPFMGKIKPYTPGTKRARLIDLLRKGTTREQIHEVLKWDLKTARCNIRLVHSLHGYGIKEDESGLIRLVVK